MSKLIEKAVYLLKFFGSKRISRSSAALAYYITLSVFPFVICLNTAAAHLGLALPELIDAVRGIVPKESYELINQYIHYVSQNDSPVLFAAASILLITTSASAFRVLMSTIRDCVGEARYSGIKAFVFSFFLAVGTIFALYFALFIILSGDRFVSLLASGIIGRNYNNKWRIFRYLLLFAVLYIFITLLNAAAINYRKGKSFALAAVSFVTSSVLVLVSALFSLAIDLSSRYTLIYGSIASVIILMLWIYFCGIVIISGSSICGYFTKREIDKKS